jgi:hypothetical protein
VRAYNTLDDIARLATEPDFDFPGKDADWFDRALAPPIFDGLREAGLLAQLGDAKLDERIELMRRSMLEPPD